MGAANACISSNQAQEIGNLFRNVMLFCITIINDILPLIPTVCMTERSYSQGNGCKDYFRANGSEIWRVLGSEIWSSALSFSFFPSPVKSGLISYFIRYII